MGREKDRVLFVCVHNSARSQMAEAFLNRLGGDRFEALSAGLEPGTLDPLAVEAMQELGIDISGNRTKSVIDFYRRGELFSAVITVCDESSGEQCPVFPGVTRREHWSFPDPSAFTGTPAERSEQVRKVRDLIRTRIEEFLQSVKHGR